MVNRRMATMAKVRKKQNTASTHLSNNSQKKFSSIEKYQLDKNAYLGQNKRLIIYRIFTRCVDQDILITFDKVFKDLGDFSWTKNIMMQ